MLAPELKLKLLASQADKDAIKLACYANLPRAAMKDALRSSGRLQLFEILIYNEVLSVMSGDELRQLSHTCPTTLWLDAPADVDYNKVLAVLGPRQRTLPRALRLGWLIDNLDIVNEAPDSEP